MFANDDLDILRVKGFAQLDGESCNEALDVFLVTRANSPAGKGVNQAQAAGRWSSSCAPLSGRPAVAFRVFGLEAGDLLAEFHGQPDIVEAVEQSMFQGSVLKQ